MKNDSQIIIYKTSDGKTKHYSLEAIIAVGYRVNSVRGTQFRQWATERLKEYMIKGFTLDDIRLKQAGYRSRYFEELLQRIRDIRSSERMLYQKVTDIYATSIDYHKNAEETELFFQTVQKALKETDNLMLENHLKKCAAAAISSGRKDEAIAEVMQVFKKVP